MANMKTFEQMHETNKITPIVIMNTIASAVPLAELLVANGIDSMEIAIRTPHAYAIIEKIAAHVPDMFIGANTIKSAGDFLTAYNAGADYIVSPGCSNELFIAARSHRSVIRYLPAVITPSEAMFALNEGFNVLKFFPSEDYNGYHVLQSIYPSLPELKFCPTGGITTANMKKYLRLPNVLAVGMREIVDNSLIESKNFEEIERRVKEAVAIMKSLKMDPGF